MSSPVVSLILFACVYGGALLGSSLRSRIPEQYLGSDSKDVVKLATGLIGTMSALRRAESDREVGVYSGGAPRVM